MRILGIDLGGCFSSNSAYVHCEVYKNRLKVIDRPFLEPKHKSYIDCNNFLLHTIEKISPDIVAIDSPFSIPKILCDKNFEILPRDGENEISNPYLFRFTDYFIYKNFSIKPMPPAGDRIGRVTARCMKFLNDFNYDKDYIYVKNKKIKIYEVFPRQIGEFLAGKDYKNRKIEILEKLKIESFYNIFLKNRDIFDALLAAYGAFEIENSNTIYPINDKIKEEGWIYPVVNFSIGK